MLTIRTEYTPERSFLETDRASVPLGSEAGAFYPYELLLGALSACFYATLHEILVKKKLDVPKIEIVVSGEKREEVPTTLKWVNLAITVTGSVDEKQMLRSADLAAKYCSIHETISKVAVMSHEVKFQPLG